MANLITSDRAKYNLNNLATTNAEDTTIAALVAACSSAIKKFCNREFDSRSFDELYAGTNSAQLLLKQFPILSIQRVAFAPTAVLSITNTSAANQRATVAVTATGLTLVRVASGTTTTTTSVTWSGNATLTAVATAVTALGNGWSATVLDSQYANWASSDLRAIQGALNAKNVPADLYLHVSELSGYDIDAARGLLLRDGDGWYGGPNYWRVIYSAGYATVPEDVQEACAQWVADRFWQTKRDPGLSQETVSGSVSRTPFSTMPPGVRTLLTPYRSICAM